MHVLVATDGSRQSLDAARFLRATTDPSTISKIAVVAVVSPLAAVPFATDGSDAGIDELSFRTAAEEATHAVAKTLADWGPTVSTHIYSGAPAAEIIKAANRFNSGLIVLASTSTRTSAVLMGSVAHKVLNQAECPVLVHRPEPKKRKSVRKAVSKAKSTKK